MKRFVFSTLVLLFVVAFAGNASAVVTIDTQIATGQYRLLYGSMGQANVNGFFTTLAGVRSASTVHTVTDLDYSDGAAKGDGTDKLTLIYVLTNTSATETLTGIDFICNVDPIGDKDDFLSTEVPAVSFPAVLSDAEPDHYEVDDFFTGDLNSNVVVSGQLDDMNQCGGSFCDVDMALQWTLGDLAPGVSAVIEVCFSDNGQTGSERFLQASYEDPDTGNAADPTLTFSGVSGTFIPVPAAGLCMLVGLAGVAFCGRRR